MSTPRIVLKTETRMLGAAQVMIGLIHCALGYIWMQLYVRQIELLSLTYMPIALLSGYPFLGTLSYVISGIFAIEAEKKCSPKLLACTIKVNIHSLAVAMIGLVITLTEITLFLLNQVELQWAHWPDGESKHLSMAAIPYNLLGLGQQQSWNSNSLTTD
ncbi:membrane-spanning 4-domains subfamily A member 12-like isoform X2 [Eptesicus fuscus]|uniref:membrane-spanning 4-domains subfamily A member 12-like isoform X2 n=1 Tax=Eptesicus fuscus TaxID=29078 RepID=UPI0024044935|nr:membrane-spanning 4-domains subfamily A member 12-like isoform X2 [Eptesicus fuscus]